MVPGVVTGGLVVVVFVVDVLGDVDVVDTIMGVVEVELIETNILYYIIFLR